MLSIVAIAKNEIKNIKGFLASWSEIADEIVIVDTGSTDGTFRELQELEYAFDCLRVFETKWEQDFSKARNYACSKAVGNWILWADLDDRLDTASIKRIKEITAKPSQHDVFGFQVASDVGRGRWNRFMQIRLFPNLPSMKFRKSVHENLEQSISELDMVVRHEPEIIIAHLGYADEDMRKKKAIRNLEILLEHNEHDAGELAQIGDALYTLGKYHVGVGYYEEATRKNPVALTTLADKLCMGYLAFGAFEKASSTLWSMPGYSAMYYFWSGEIQRLLGIKEKALEYYRLVKGGDRMLSGRECNADSLIYEADLRIAEMEGQCEPSCVPA